jgi:effector-binding domain-containing protein
MEGNKIVMKYIIGTTILIVLTLVLTLLIKLGMFKPVMITEQDQPSFKIVYKTHIGAYHKIVPVIQEVEIWAKAHGHTCEQSVGEYLDNPNLTEEGRLRSNGGCIIEGELPAASASAAATSASTPTSDQDAFLPEGFMAREVPARHYVVADFDGAPSVSPAKVYPKVMDYIATKKLELDGPVFEIYRVVSDKAVKTRYLFPVKSK